jgi:hypothetical protein
MSWREVFIKTVPEDVLQERPGEFPRRGLQENEYYWYIFIYFLFPLMRILFLVFQRRLSHPHSIFLIWSLNSFRKCLGVRMLHAVYLSENKFLFVSLYPSPKEIFEIPHLGYMTPLCGECDIWHSHNSYPVLCVDGIIRSSNFAVQYASINVIKKLWWRT